MPQTHALSLVIPAHNEAHRIGDSLRHLKSYAAQRPHLTLEITVVDDGSTDDTARIVSAFDPTPARLRLLKNDTRRGKGYSVRRGMLDATGDPLLMCDADMSTPIEELDKLLPFLTGDVGVVIGSRVAPGASLEPPQGAVRRTLHRLFRSARRNILLPDLLDTQCGFKLFSRDAARRLFPLQTIDGFAFDCELLALARATGIGIREVGVTWRNDPRSAVRLFRDGFAVLRDIYKIQRRMKNRQENTP